MRTPRFSTAGETEGRSAARAEPMPSPQHCCESTPARVGGTHETAGFPWALEREATPADEREDGLSMGPRA